MLNIAYKHLYEVSKNADGKAIVDFMNAYQKVYISTILHSSAPLNDKLLLLSDAMYSELLDYAIESEERNGFDSDNCLICLKSIKKVLRQLQDTIRGNHFRLSFYVDYLKRLSNEIPAVSLLPFSLLSAFQLRNVCVALQNLI